MLTLKKGRKNYYGVFYVDRKHKWISFGTDNEVDAKSLHDNIQAQLKQTQLKSRINRLLGNKESKPRPLLIRDVEKNIW